VAGIAIIALYFAIALSPGSEAKREYLVSLFMTIFAIWFGFFIGMKIFKAMKGEKEHKEKPSHKYYCSKCKSKVGEEDTKCPKCGSLLAEDGAVIIKKVVR